LAAVVGHYQLLLVKQAVQEFLLVELGLLVMVQVAAVAAYLLLGLMRQALPQAQAAQAVAAVAVPLAEQVELAAAVAFLFTTRILENNKWL
jgi:hypothetical protein